VHFHDSVYFPVVLKFKCKQDTFTGQRNIITVVVTFEKEICFEEKKRGLENLDEK